jgi:hypothetical protein
VDAPLFGPDGYPLAAGAPRFRSHQRISDYLLAEEQRQRTTAPFDPVPWRKLPKGEVAPQVEAVLERLQWLVDHDAELEQGHLSRLRLQSLLRFLHRVRASYGEPDLCRLLERTTTLLGRIEPYGPVERVVSYLKANDLTPTLCTALRNFQANLREEGSVSQASMQSLRQQLHLLLWLDEWEPLDPARCWSECVRRDFRTMTGERRVRWRALLKHIRGNAPVRMPSSWARDAAAHLEAVGADDFRSCIQDWFAPFQSGERLPLSVAGSHVLKALIWYCAVSRDPELPECALWLLQAQWKQKRHTEKVLTALSVFGIAKEELIRRQLIKPPTPAPATRLIERLMNARALSTDGRIEPDGDTLIVQGQLHFYRLSRSTGRIERVTDGATIDLNWPAIPDHGRLMLNRECDSEQQLALRASLLVHDAVFGNWFQPV